MKRGGGVKDSDSYGAEKRKGLSVKLVKCATALTNGLHRL